ncbi:MAG: protoheme IX farnesyltransferase [Acidobacteria bacterium]|nr:protoheme IX farnesyltransferase [Acidobacteriota bacterium]
MAADAWQVGRIPRLHLAEYLELTKPRVTTMVLVTTTVGFYAGSARSMDLRLLLYTLIGTALTAAGSSALNQFLERGPDGLMRRTENRPLPAGRLKPANALWFGIIISVLGLLYLAMRVSLLSSLLALAIWSSYLFLYTPLKQKTSLCTLIGAFPGAGPPIIGWAGSAQGLDLRAWTLFLILFLWQFPHFLAIAWMYRDDYQKAGFRMLPLEDRQGFITGRQILVYTTALIPISLLPSLLGMAGQAYLFGAIALGLLFLYFGFKVAESRSTEDARRLLKASVLYLPLLLALMVIDRP